MALIQRILRRAELLALCNHARQGDPHAASQLLRAFVNGEAASDMLDPGGTGFSGGTGTVRKTSVVRSGGIIKAEMLIDLTGLGSSTTDRDVIGTGTNPAYLVQYRGERLGGVPFAGRLECLELPAGGVTDIDFDYASVGTGKFDDLVTGLTGQANLITSGGAWAAGTVKVIADPVSLVDKYLYLTCGAAGTPGTYTAGKFLLTLLGYDS